MYISNQTQHTPSFKGLTKVFKNKLISDAKTYEQLISTTQKEFIGALPKEIIDKIISISRTQDEKNTIIKNILNAFAKASKELQKTELEPQSHVSRLKTNLEEQEAITQKAAKLISEIFQKNKLINPTEQIKINPFEGNEGAFGTVFDLIFPKSLHCPKKIIKIFKGKKPELLKPKYLNLHGPAAEANAALYITKHQGAPFQKKSVFVKPYICSPQHRFMINEHLDNYANEETDWHKIQRFFNDKNILCIDIVPGWDHNVRNSRIYDFGAIEKLNSKLNHKAFKIFKKLEHADRKGIFTKNNDPLLALIAKYLSAPQKATKNLPFEIDSAIQNFVSTRQFEPEVINKINELKPTLLK